MPRGRSITNDSYVPGAVRRGDGRRARLLACNSACADVTSHQLPRYENPETNRQLRDNLAISLKRNIFTGPSRESPARRNRSLAMTSRHPLSSARSWGPSSALGLAFHARVYFTLIRISSKTFEIERHNHRQGRIVDMRPWIDGIGESRNLLRKGHWRVASKIFF